MRTVKIFTVCDIVSNPSVFVISLEPERSEPESHRVTASAPAPVLTKRCGSLRLRLRPRNTGIDLYFF
jgi:hypothetical protein